MHRAPEIEAAYDSESITWNVYLFVRSRGWALNF